MHDIYKPLVSIITPCYNHENYIEEYIESIYAQTYKNFEFFIIDDGSGDGSLEIIRKMAEKYHFQYEFQSNLGICRTLNKLLKKVNGKYIIVMASDDVMMRDRLERQVKFMEMHPEYGMSYGKHVIINEKGEKLKAFDIHRDINPNIHLSGWIFDQLLTYGTFISAGTVIMKKDALQEVGQYDESLLASEDCDMWLRISLKFQVGYLDEPMMYYRSHSKNTSIYRSKDLKIDWMNVLKKYENYLFPKKNYYNISLCYSYFIKHKITSIKYLFKSCPYGLHFINIYRYVYNLLFHWN